MIYKQFYHIKSRLLVGGFLSPAVSGFFARFEGVFFALKIAPVLMGLAKEARAGR